MSIGTEAGPLIGMQKGPPGGCVGACPGSEQEGPARDVECPEEQSGTACAGGCLFAHLGKLLGDRSGAVLEAPAFVAGLDDLAVMGQAIEQGRRHLRVPEDARPFAKVEVGGDDDRGLLVEMADQMEQELPASSGRRADSQFIEDGEVRAGEPVGDPPLALRADLALEPVDQIDDLEEPAPALRRGCRRGRWRWRDDLVPIVKAFRSRSFILQIVEVRACFGISLPGFQRAR